MAFRIPEGVNEFVVNHIININASDISDPTVPDECPICQDDFDASHPAVRITNNDNCSHVFGRPCLLRVQACNCLGDLVEIFLGEVYPGQALIEEFDELRSKATGMHTRAEHMHAIVAERDAETVEAAGAVEFAEATEIAMMRVATEQTRRIGARMRRDADE
ncbi:hypothetical protein BU16DRAFT_567634 [Lophium mytilinum]|uniref:Zinc finger RING-type eukaryotic domain-containing protein n=1 Tax=Lophium mytilinum TaxID=390894 RepID=A0A6A6QBS7_9PEZI|nr:hypothetical protein BU16DRAFT_567634 [Lophium mytilinum]